MNHKELYPAIHSYSSRRCYSRRRLWGNRFYPGYGQEISSYAPAAKRTVIGIRIQ